MEPGSGDRHISLFGLYYVCAICGQFLDLKKPMVALAGNASLSSFKAGFIQRFERRYPFDENYGPWKLCTSSGIWCVRFHCYPRPGCAVHPDCLQVYMRNCTADDVLDRLWQACVWRRVPWTGSFICDIPMLPRPIRRFADAFVRCADLCGIPWLCGLPQLVIETIMEFLPEEHYFWRCVAALDMADRLSAVRAEPLRIVQLSHLVSWERGTLPRVASEEEPVANLPPFVRLTIDVDGLCKVERLEKRPDFGKRRFDDRVFVIERVDDLGVSLAKFKNGLLQLSILEDMQEIKLAVWDTPTPPDLSRCLAEPKKPLSMRQYHTIDLATITGLTFLFAGRDLQAVHAHTRTYPSAMSTYQSATKTLRENNRDYIWIYVPLPPGDTLLSCGPVIAYQCMPSRTLYGPLDWYSFLIRTNLSGEFVIGRCACEKVFWDGRGNDNWATPVYLVNDPGQPPKMLVYRTGSDWPRSFISYISPYNEQGPPDMGVTPWYHPPLQRPPLQDPDWSWYRHSHAPLSGVRKVTVFYHPEGMTCMGMLLGYDNGGQRAVGECRLYVHPSKTFPRPSFIAFLNLPEDGERVRVLFDELPQLDEDERGNHWCYYAMEGTLDFWFKENDGAISVRDGRPMSREEISKNG